MGLKIIFFNKLDFTLLSKNLVRNRNKFGAKSLQIWCEIVINQGNNLVRNRYKFGAKSLQNLVRNRYNLVREIWCEIVFFPIPKNLRTEYAPEKS